MTLFRSQMSPSFEGGVHYATRSRKYAENFTGDYMVTFEVSQNEIVGVEEALKGTMFLDCLIPVVSSGDRPLLDVLSALERAGRRMSDVDDPCRIRGILLDCLTSGEAETVYALSDEESLGVKRFLSSSRQLFKGLVEDMALVFPGAVGISDPNGKGENVILLGNACKRVTGVYEK